MTTRAPVCSCRTVSAEPVYVTVTTGLAVLYRKAIALTHASHTVV
jgi:hypothetical protein